MNHRINNDVARPSTLCVGPRRNVASPQKSPQNSCPGVTCNDLRCRPCVPSHCKCVFVSEKAGVGGSTPSLATIIPKGLVQSRRALSSPLSVRSCETSRGCLRNGVMQKNLGGCNSSAVRFQSALVGGVAENRCNHFPCCSH